MEEEKMEYRGSVSRIRKCAFDFLSISMEMDDDLMMNDDESEEEWWELTKRDLHLKSTFLYCDLNRVISSAASPPPRDDDDKKKKKKKKKKNLITELANKFFYYMEELDSAVKSRDISLTQIHYSDAIGVLQELLAALLPPP